MRARAIDYSVYSEESLFMELDSTSEQIEQLAEKKAQIEQALREKAKVPNDETIKAMQECEKESLLDKKSQIEQALHSIPTDETADALKNAVSLPQYTSHEQLVKELQAEIAAENANNRH